MADQKKRDIEPHPLVTALQPDPTKPPIPTVKLLGFPGPGPDPKLTRLWLDSDLNHYVDIPTASIHHSSTLPGDAGTVVWVSQDTALSYGSTTATSASEFLSGSIAAQHFGAAAAGASGEVGAAPRGISLGAPCISLPVVCRPTLVGPCANPTLPHTCPSLPIICHSAAVVACSSHVVPCNASFASPCFSHNIPCQTPHLPSVVTICQSVTSPCVTHAVWCMSAVLVCRTLPAVCHVSAQIACPTPVCPSVAFPCQSVPFCGGGGGGGGGGNPAF
jgi:hypothetical protein